MIHGQEVPKGGGVKAGKELPLFHPPPSFISLPFPLMGLRDCGVGLVS
jgi:hypothetical protein